MLVLDHTHSLCSQCLQVLPARIVETGARVFLEKECPLHGPQQALLSSDSRWYKQMLSFAPPRPSPAESKTPLRRGCPWDCGLCPSHGQSVYLPVVPVTSACNLDCPVCYTLNKNRNAYFMSQTEFSAVLEQICSQEPGARIINFTGGEPLLHPRFCDLVELCRRAGIRRITISTNGLRFLEDPDLLPRLTAQDARIVLSFNSFYPEPYRAFSGQDLLSKKLKILGLLEKYKPSTTLLSVVAAGINDQEIGEIVRFVLASDFIVSSEIHTVAFTGQNIGRFDSATRLTVPDVIRAIRTANPGFYESVFGPSPCSHPLCYSICYVLKTETGPLVPFTDFMNPEEIRRLLVGSLYMEPTAAGEEILNDALNTLWSKVQQTENDRQVLKTLANLLRDMYGSPYMEFQNRQKRAEKTIKAVYIHSHMDAANFDLARVQQCCVAVPDGQGRWIPTCAYNTIYRARDPRFNE